MATAFVTSAAAAHLLASVRSDMRVRILTGTFGNTTRRSTFKQLLDASRRSARVETRIWSSGTHSNLHVKLYLWRLPRGAGVAWIGSTNLTDGGLQNDGELVLEVADRWNAPLLRTLRVGFEREWRRGEPITPAFVESYREALRPAPDARVMRPHRRAVAPRRSRRSRYFVTSVDHYYAEGGPAANRIERRLGGRARYYFRLGASRVGQRLREGHEGFLVDLLAREVALIRVSDAVRDGKGTAVAYEPVLSRDTWVRWTPALRRHALAAAGLRARGLALGTRWLTPSAFSAIARVLYPQRRLATLS